MPGFLTSLFATLTMFFPGLMTRMTMVLTGEASNGLSEMTGMVADIMEMVVTVVTAFAGLFTIWPLNLILVLGIIGFCVGFFFKGKKGARV